MLTHGGGDALRVFFDTFADTRILICEPTFPYTATRRKLRAPAPEACRYDQKMQFPLAT